MLPLAALTVCFLSALTPFSWATNDGIEMVRSMRRFFEGRPSREDIFENRQGLSESFQQGKEGLRGPALLRNCAADEGEAHAIMRDLLEPWAEAWRRGGAESQPRWAEDAERNAWHGPVKGEPRAIGKIRHWKWKRAAGATMTEYIRGFSRIEDVSVDLLFLKAGPKERNDDFSLRTARSQIRLDVRGFEGEARRHDRVVLDAFVRKTKAGWRMVKLDLLEGETLRHQRASYQESHVPPLSAASRAGVRSGFALSTADFDGDGKVDLFVGGRERSWLLRGDGKGGFSDSGQEEISALTHASSAVFGDFLGSGRQDLLVLRFRAEYSVSGSPVGPAQAELALFRNRGKGKLTRTPVVDGIPWSQHFSPSLAVADFNRDGRLDFFRGISVPKAFPLVSGGQVVGSPVAVSGLYLGGKAGFRRAPAPAPSSPSAHSERLYFPAALAVDFNRDGASDLLVIDDERGNLVPALLNDGRGGFLQADRQISDHIYGYGMGIAAGDVDGDGILDLALTNVTFSAMERLALGCEENWEIKIPFINLNPHLQLFKGLGGGKFAEVSRASGLTFPGEGLAGVEFVDYNGDGLDDIFVANGLWSGDSREQDLGRFFYGFADGAVPRFLFMEGEPQASPLYRFLTGFRGDIDEKGEGMERPSLGGFQRKRLYRNLGGGKFLEVGFLEGVDSIADGYTVARADLDGDGREDLILRNADPGVPEAKFPPVQVFMNKNDEGNHTLKISLLGKKSNLEGIGAEVEVWVKGRRQVKQMLANSGTVQSQKALIFGLGKARKADHVIVRWPSGKVGRWRGLFGSAMLREGI